MSQILLAHGSGTLGPGPGTLQYDGPTSIAMTVKRAATASVGYQLSVKSDGAINIIVLGSSSDYTSFTYSGNNIGPIGSWEWCVPLAAGVGDHYLARFYYTTTTEISGAISPTGISSFGQYMQLSSDRSLGMVYQPANLNSGDPNATETAEINIDIKDYPNSKSITLPTINMSITIAP